jgi:hypothetical protein
MRKIVAMAAMAGVLFSQGCCSVFTPGPQTISFNSKPSGARVSVGPHTGIAPFQVSMSRGKTYVIVAEYQGKSQTQELPRTIEGVYWINILFWPGLIIDLATGKMFKYEPTQYEFSFE